MIDHLDNVVHDQEKEIAELASIKQVFLRNLQHETNTPLTGIYSMSQALSDCYEKLSEEQRKNAIEHIKTSSERLISYVHNLVDVSKLTTSRFKLDIRTVNLSKVVVEAARKCKRFYIASEIEDDREIILDIEPNLITKCDEYLITRSFENLIINAIRYCRRGQIVITLAKDQSSHHIRFSVMDSGIGVPQEELSYIFESFTVSSRTKTSAGGRGLGLTFVKAAIEMHRGKVIAESTKGMGSTFTILLPSLQS
jgi:signal transduction histidine kinase